MNLFFVLQTTGFFISVILLNHWVNLLLIRRTFFELKYLPCFAWGWFVYLAIYMIGRWASASVESVRLIYTAMALLIPTLAGVGYLSNPHASMWQRRRRDLPLDLGTMLLVSAFIGGMIYVGPYLEFPSDPVEHLYRIQAWEKVLRMNYNADDYSESVSRFAYFFEHWLLQPSHISLGNRTGLLLLSPILQGMLFWQFIRLTKLMTNQTTLSWLGGLMSLGYFGYSAASFYRYTVLGGALLAYLIFLEGLILIISFYLKEEWRYLFLLPPLLVFSWNNHQQETLLQFNSVVSICTALVIFRYRTISPRISHVMLIVIFALLAICVFIAFNKTVLDINGATMSTFLVSVSTPWGGKMQFHRFEPLNQMMGVLGWLSMISAVLVLFLNRPYRNLDIMAGLCISPLIVLWNPLLVEVWLRFSLIDVSHRLIYGSLYWLFPVVFLQHICQIYCNSTNTWVYATIFNYLPKIKLSVLNKFSLYIIIIFFIILSWIPVEPIRGKMSHLSIKVDSRLDGSNLKPTIEYLREHASQKCLDPYPNANYLPIRRYILSDSYVNTYLLATGYFYAVTNRRESEGYESPFLGLTVYPNEQFSYYEFIETIKKNQICYVVLYLQTQNLYSWMGAVLGHWSTDSARTIHYYSPKFIKWITENPQDFELVFEDDVIRVFKALAL